MSKTGKFIVIEGLDGSGKGTVTAMLEQYLREKGEEVRRISFPRYDLPSSTLLKMYLGGELGEHPEDTGAYAASTLFSVDRYVSYRVDWSKTLAEGVTVIADRYTTANAVHQCSKLPREEWDPFLEWLFDFEYGKLGLPAPDATVYVEMPPRIAHRLIAARAAETGRSVDIHETDPHHLDRAYEAGLYACGKLGWLRVPNFKGDDVRPLDETFAELLEKTGL